MAINHRRQHNPANESDQNRQRVLHHLTTNYQLNQPQVAAVMAAIRHESNFLLGQIGDRHLGRGREAHGLFQWREQRHTNLNRFLAARPGQDPVTAQVDFAMHEMGIPRKDNLNVPGPAFGNERQAGDMLKRSRTLGQAVEAMHKFERYDNSGGETNRRAQTAQGFLQQVANAIASAYNTVRETVGNVGDFIGGAFKRVLGSPEAPTPPRSGWRMATTLTPIQSPHYSPYGVPQRAPDQRPHYHAAPAARPEYAAPAPAPAMRTRPVGDHHPPAPTHRG